MVTTLINGERVGDDPWEGNTLEWATTSPPPPYNFDALPPIRSERPVFDLRHKHDVEHLAAEQVPLLPSAGDDGDAPGEPGEGRRVMSVDAPTSVSADMGSSQLVSPHREAGMPTPLVGMLLFIASEVMFFGGAVRGLLQRAGRVRRVWGPSRRPSRLEFMPIALPITIILLTSSLTMHFGVLAIRARRSAAPCASGRSSPCSWASSS